MSRHWVSLYVKAMSDAVLLASSTALLHCISEEWQYTGWERKGKGPHFRPQSGQTNRAAALPPTVTCTLSCSYLWLCGINGMLLTKCEVHFFTMLWLSLAVATNCCEHCWIGTEHSLQDCTDTVWRWFTAALTRSVTLGIKVQQWGQERHEVEEAC